jgi:hypothetical protein
MIPCLLQRHIVIEHYIGRNVHINLISPQSKLKERIFISCDCVWAAMIVGYRTDTKQIWKCQGSIHNSGEASMLLKACPA